MLMASSPRQQPGQYDPNAQQYGQPAYGQQPSQYGTAPQYGQAQYPVGTGGAPGPKSNRTIVIAAIAAVVVVILIVIAAVALAGGGKKKSSLPNNTEYGPGPRHVCCSDRQCQRVSGAIVRAER